MQFRIADTFTDSLARLTGDEQKAVKTTAFDLQLNPANPGMQFHKLEKARDKSFWSVRVNADIRLIVHKTEGSLLLCYVDHHDKAYAWAERRKVQTHPKTGAAQLVEIRETVQEIVIPSYVTADVSRSSAPKKRLFDSISDGDLLGFGIPAEWLADVRAATEDSVFTLADHLPSEAGEALLELAIGGKPRVPQPTAAPFEHPDAQRRFRLLANQEELARALDFPWEKWTVFLHPEQRQLVERGYPGPARVSGSAGTGKTIVALHRAAYLARTNPDSRILLTTFSDALASALLTRLNRLLSSEPRLAERIDVHSLGAIAQRLHKMHLGAADLATREVIRQLIYDSSNGVGGHKFTQHFLLAEWEQVVDAWQLNSWKAYRDVARLGRKTRLPEAQRQILWTIFEKVRAGLDSRRLEDQTKAGVMPHEFGLFVRCPAQLQRATRAAQAAGLPFKILDDGGDGEVGHVSVGTMHLAKGLEFRGVAVMACDDEVIPLQSRIESVGDDADLKEVYDTERHLLYVACTRARDSLLVTCVEPGSEFLDDFQSSMAK